MRSVERTNQFKKDFKLACKRGKQLSRLEAVIDSLAQDEPLHPRHKPHRLSGNMEGYHECHIEPDYLLIYEYRANTLVLVRLGTHSDLF